MRLPVIYLSTRIDAHQPILLICSMSVFRSRTLLSCLSMCKTLAISPHLEHERLEVVDVQEELLGAHLVDPLEPQQRTEVGREEGLCCVVCCVVCVWGG